MRVGMRSAVAMFVVLGFGLACSGVPGGSCTINTTQCENDKLSVCNADGSWQETMECPTGTSCGETQGIAACIPDGMDGGAGEGGGGKAGKRKAGGAH